ncbi:MAG: RNA methyltransferase [Ignavibacteria bacterium]|nr:RNA methyltransferase [Ignavibacteria bacterium]
MQPAPLSKARIKLYSSLLSKKGRTRHNKVFVDGLRVVEELSEKTDLIECIIVSESWWSAHAAAINSIQRKYELCIVPDSGFAKIADTENPQGIGAIVKITAFLSDLPKDREEGVYLYLDRIQDPGNLGTIFRTALWFGVDGIILSSGTAEIFNPKVIRSSMGAVFFVKFIYDDENYSLINRLSELGHVLIAADMQGTNLFQEQIPGSGITIIIGSEAHGVSKSLLDKCDKIVSIPRLGGGESLNAAIAAAIFIAHYKQ